MQVQQVVCITFTSASVAELLNRTVQNDVIINVQSLTARLSHTVVMLVSL